jgi:hypothetical protein
MSNTRSTLATVTRDVDTSINNCRLRLAAYKQSYFSLGWYEIYCGLQECHAFGLLLKMLACYSLYEESGEERMKQRRKEKEMKSQRKC